LARRALGVELRRRGIAEDDARAALGTLTHDDEEARARALVARRLPSTRGQPATVRARRLLGLLARKGYPGGLASAVVREALAGDADPGELDAAPADTPD
jgi:regulatory protein